MVGRAALPFVLGEYEARLAAVRRAVDAAGIEVLLVSAPENIVYLTGYHSLGYFTFQLLIVSLEAPPILVTRELNREKVLIDSCIERIEGYRDTDDPNDVTYAALAQHGLATKRIASQHDAWFFSVARYHALAARLGVAGLADGAGLVERARRLKSAREIAYIREAGRYGAASLDGAIDAVAPGVLETEVSAAAHDRLHRAGSEYLGHSAQFVAGTAAGLAFECAGRRPIGANDVVYMEAGGTHNRYNAMLSRTVMVGKPDRKWIAMAEASRDALAAAKAAIKPGVTSHEVDRAARETMRRAGFGEHFKHRTGYSVGIGFPPDWGEGRIMSINEDDPTVLEPGMCFHLIPDLKIAGPGGGGVVFSECVAVTEDGYAPLSEYSSEIVFK